MNDTTVEPRGAIPEQEWKGSPWARRVVLIVFCLALLATLGAMFTRVIAARVPEQRATLEKLITDRTGLAVRFDNVHFAWGLKGTSAVFEKVELTDPARGRVRVVAPELRVEFDAWDFLRHQQFSLGHVTLSSPDIDIIGDAEPAAVAEAGVAARKSSVPAREEDEAAWVRHFTTWAELMPLGRVEVEGARVHLFRRGERKARHDFTLSQAVVSRGNSSFSAFGTMLLSQDVGQSLFVSAKLERVGSLEGVDGELRLIARRVFLDKMSSLLLRGSPAAREVSVATHGRGTVDASLELQAGRIREGKWQLSARELELPRERRFDHFTVQGKLSRAQDDLLFQFTDLQLTRGARLERAPKLSVRVSLVPGTLRVARTTMTAERLPFMAAEFLAGVLAPLRTPDLPEGWNATAGELRAVRYDSRAGSFTAQVSGAEITRPSDRSRISQLAARVEIARGESRLVFPAGNDAQLHLPGAAEPRSLGIAGTLTLRASGSSPDVEFAALRVDSGEGWLQADGAWTDDAARKPLTLAVSNVDRALIGDAWTLLALAEKFPQLAPQMAEVQQVRIVSGQLHLVSLLEAGERTVNWQRSRGTLQLADLASAGEGVPTLASAAGNLEFARGGTQLRLTSGRIEDLDLSQARIEWPRRGTPRLVASLQGDLASPLLRRAFEQQGLERLTGSVSLEAEARGEQELRDARLWRVTARLRDASLPLSASLPPVEALAGTVRFDAGQLRGVALTGNWLGGAVKVDSRRAGARGVTSASIQGESDAAPLLKLLGRPEAADQVNGQLAWSGSLQRRDAAQGGGGDDSSAGWTVSLNSDLAGVESRLPEPFDKTRARHVQVNAELHFDARGVQGFTLQSGRDEIRGRIEGGVTLARFDVQGVAGEWRAAQDDPTLNLDKLELRRAPAVLAAAGALLPADSELAIQVAQLRHANRGLGAVAASLARRDAGVEFALDSVAGTPHELHADGECTDAGGCRMEFSLQTRQLPDLLASAELPAEWPTRSLRASGELAWRANAPGDITRALSGNFELETQGADAGHQLVASARLADGQIELANVQGTGPEPDQMFRGSGRVGLLARTYDLSVDYEQVTLAASAMPTPARARLARAWSSLRGSAVKRGWTEATPARRVQWHGSWDNEP